MPHHDYKQTLDDALRRHREGMDPKLIELPELSVFPALICAAPTTARIARITGTLLGRPAPKFVKRGRAVRYRLADILKWLEEGETYGSNAEWHIA